MKKEFGFSLVELLSTIAVIAALSGVGMAVYVQYQDRAYLSSSLQQGVQLRTAFEAGLSGQSSLGSTIFNENRNFQFLIDSSQSCDNCDGYSFSEVFVGFSPQRGVGLTFSVADNQTYTITTAHCRNAIEGTESADGWIVSDEQASVAAAISMTSDHLGACSDVLAGGAIPSPTPGEYCENGTCDPSESAESCPNDCPAVCGDEACTHDEISSSCPIDCNPDINTCGNGSCDGGEHCEDCPEDCGFQDDCGVQCGDNSSCLDCAGNPNGGATEDSCGICGGDGSSCADCNGVPNGGASIDSCGVCGGDNSSCADCNGVPNGSSVLDACGVCDGDGSSC